MSGVVYDIYPDYRYVETERGEGEITIETRNLVLVNFFEQKKQLKIKI